MTHVNMTLNSIVLLSHGRHVIHQLLVW